MHLVKLPLLKLTWLEYHLIQVQYKINKLMKNPFCVVIEIGTIILTFWWRS
jgi:hypothetical protein